eukprot:SAG31_NODE_523_length_14545_cov_4.805067_6_plen_88_part_00
MKCRAMNNFDLKHRIAGLAVEGGVGAIVESLIKLIRDKDVAQEVEDKIMTVACNLFKRLRANGSFARAGCKNVLFLHSFENADCLLC